MLGYNQPCNTVLWSSNTKAKRCCICFCLLCATAVWQVSHSCDLVLLQCQDSALQGSNRPVDLHTRWPGHILYLLQDTGGPTLEGACYHQGKVLPHPLRWVCHLATGAYRELQIRAHAAACPVRQRCHGMPEPRFTECLLCTVSLLADTPCLVTNVCKQECLPLKPVLTLLPHTTRPHSLQASLHSWN